MTGYSTRRSVPAVPACGYSRVQVRVPYVGGTDVPVLSRKLPSHSILLCQMVRVLDLVPPKPPPSTSRRPCSTPRSLAPLCMWRRFGSKTQAAADGEVNEFVV